MKTLKGPILIIGFDKKSTKSTVNEIFEDLNIANSENNPDLLTIKIEKEKKSIGIDQVKQLIRFFLQKPYKGTHKIAFVENAGKITLDGQNALLKTLEELPSYGSLILEVQAEGELIPTVISRCQKIYVKNISQPEKNSHDPTSLTLDRRLELAKEIGEWEKDDVITFLQNFVVEERAKMLATKDLQVAKAHKDNIKRCLEIIDATSHTNAGVRLALEALFLNLL